MRTADNQWKLNTSMHVSSDTQVVHVPVCNVNSVQNSTTMTIPRHMPNTRHVVVDIPRYRKLV